MTATEPIPVLCPWCDRDSGDPCERCRRDGAETVEAEVDEIETEER